jgi:hypothetical protein
MKSVRGELGGVALGGRQTADCLVDSVHIDQSRLENRRVIDHLGNSGRGSAIGTASLSVEGDAVDAPVVHEERDPREVPAGSPTRRAGKGPVGGRSNPAVITKVVLEKLTLHGHRVERGGVQACRMAREHRIRL